MRIKVPFQFKIYGLILLLFAGFIFFTVQQINGIVAHQMMQEEKKEFQGLRSIFNTLLSTQIESLNNEALLLADLQVVQQFLRNPPEASSQNHLLLPKLRQMFPRVGRWPVIVFTDSRGNLITGRVNTQNSAEPIITEPNVLKQFQPSVEDIMHRLGDEPLVRYNKVEQERINTFFGLCTVLVRDSDPPHRIIGTVTLGFAVDKSLAFKLRSGSDYHVGFILGRDVVSVTLNASREREMQAFWQQVQQRESMAFLQEPQLVSIGSQRYFVYGSPLPTHEDASGYYLILKPLEHTLGAIQQLRRSLFWVSLIILCAALILGYILARGVTAPLRRLAGIVSRIAEGDYSVSAHVQTGDEFETLSREISGMAKTLQQREAEIQDYVLQIEEWNRQLETKVAQRTKDLEEKNIRLRMISEELGRAYAQIDDELKLVGELQKQLLPEKAYKHEDISIHALYMPNGRAGGDYYDYLRPNPRQIFFLIADVSGHGTPAAFIMGITRAIAHTMIARENSTAEVLRQLSSMLLKMVRSGEFVTMFLACLDCRTQRLTYSSAGHPAPLLLRKTSGQLDELNVEQGLPLGIMEDADYDEVTIPMRPGDRLLLYTDGIVEASDEHKKQYGVERLQDILGNNHDFSLDDLLEVILQDLTAFVQKPLDVEPLDDDITLVAIDFNLVPAASTLLMQKPAY